jgi:hypothetical protein
MACVPLGLKPSAVARADAHARSLGPAVAARAPLDQQILSREQRDPERRLQAQPSSPARAATDQAVAVSGQIAGAGRLSGGVDRVAPEMPAPPTRRTMGYLAAAALARLGALRRSVRAPPVLTLPATCLAGHGDLRRRPGKDAGRGSRLLHRVQVAYRSGRRRGDRSGYPGAVALRSQFAVASSGRSSCDSPDHAWHSRGRGFDSRYGSAAG